jgi:ABC-type antimicrobial peptide transport system permease subunit
MVTQRTNEIGVRLALGATRGEIWRLFAGRGLALTVIGLAIGIGLSAMAARLMRSLMFGFEPGYGAVIAVVSAVLLGVAAVACIVPARRASGIDPVVALRHE